jgi:hypothetical protein
VAHTEILEETDPHGYLLLRCLRSYIILDMYAALEVHTTETIAAGRAEVLKFSALMKVCFFSPYQSISQSKTGIHHGNIRD